MVTRDDVARRAGTSPAVVSYVLNEGSRPVAEATRDRVLKAVEELDYRPNRIARSLRMNKTMTLGLVVPDSANPFFAELANAVEDAAFTAGFTLLLGNSAEDLDRQRKYLDSFTDNRVDGIFLAPAVGTTAEQMRSFRLRSPVVLLDRSLPGVEVPLVVVNNSAASRQATDHLFEHGRTHLACIGGPADSNPSSERLAGFLAALDDVGQDATNAIVRHSAFGRRAGYLAAKELLQQERLDAFFITSDEQATGVLRAITEAGLSCPQDIALVSFDGIAASAYTVPALTSMAQPITALGATAVEAMTSLITGSAEVPPVTRLQAELVRRGSCGCDDPTGGESAKLPTLDATEKDRR